MILPEMLQAGMQTLDECRDRDCTDAETCVAVYLAMEAIKAMAEMREPLVIH